MTGTLHVVGAGLSGLACAVAAARAGQKVAVYEAAAHAGGRCRSFRCTRLNRVIDNGTHLLLGANREALAFAKAVGGHETIVPLPPRFPMLDLPTGTSWTVEPNRLNAGLWEGLRAIGLPWLGRSRTVAAHLGRTRSFITLWRPLCEAILNTPPETASASMLADVLRHVLMGGPQSLHPLLAASGLSALFAAPAEATLAAFGASLTFRRRLTEIGERWLEFDGLRIPLGHEDVVVLAVPPWAASSLLPGLPDLPTQAIVNAHFRLEQVPHIEQGPFLGFTGGTAQWLFVREDVVSVTVSAADHLMEMPAEELSRRLWHDIAAALGADPTRIPPVRVVKEKRATLAHTPECLIRRPGPRTRHDWLFLAGDWLASPWPCTMEAAVQSGLQAARLALGRDDLSFA